MSTTSCNLALLHFAVIFLYLSLKATISIGSESFDTISPSPATGYGLYNDTISTGQSLSGNLTKISSNGVFELGFFNPGNSHNYFIGIRYTPEYGNSPFTLSASDRIAVWVANRNQPVSDPSASAFKFNEDGNLVLLSPTKLIIWSSNLTSNNVNSTKEAVLLDNGNFVLRKTSGSREVIWQSFDYPTDTWLPGQKLGFNKLTVEATKLVSWNTSIDPSTGAYYSEATGRGSMGILIMNKSNLYWGVEDFSSLPEIRLYFHNPTFVSNENESYCLYTANPDDELTRIVLDPAGQLQQHGWSNSRRSWRAVWRRPTQICGTSNFSLCGDFGICNEQKTPICTCVQGFEPKRQVAWTSGDQTEGCERNTTLQCKTDRFVRYSKIRYPFNTEYLVVDNINECKLACQRDCSCSAFVYDTQCLIFKGEVGYLRRLPDDDPRGTDFYFRIADSEPVRHRYSIKKLARWFVLVAVVGFFALSGILLAIMWRRKSYSAIELMDDSLMLLNFQDLKKATINFSEKIGEGGFGCVFKGTLPNSTVIAVKKLGSLKQSEKQFRSELSTIGAIHHRNLVRLRGFCIDASRRFLIYEYMSNGSLESYLFRKDCVILSWRTRYSIAIGIARGLAYLHDSCRDCIIHCDIKPENILLDKDYNPKVADFGLAKLVGRDFSRVLTTMRGTIGYLAPEWISGEPITPKVDVFSYGKLLFEIISGKRNISLPQNELDNYFPAVVAKAINRGEEIQALLDYKVSGRANIEQLNRACKVACWCIHDEEKFRPSMSQVVLILEGLLEVNMPPIPRFFQRLADDHSGKETVYRDTETSSGSKTCSSSGTSSGSY